MATELTSDDPMFESGVSKTKNRRVLLPWGKFKVLLINRAHGLEKDVQSKHAALFITMDELRDLPLFHVRKPADTTLALDPFLKHAGSKHGGLQGPWKVLMFETSAEYATTSKRYLINITDDQSNEEWRNALDAMVGAIECEKVRQLQASDLTWQLPESYPHRALTEPNHLPIILWLRPPTAPEKPSTGTGWRSAPSWQASSWSSWSAG